MTCSFNGDFSQHPQAFIIVHTEYDSIAEFYNKLSRFLDQLTVIEGKSPTDGSFEKAVACIFACQLDVLGIAHEYTETKHGLFRTRQTSKCRVYL